MDIRERVQAQLGCVEDETKRLSMIHEETVYKDALEAFNEKNKEKMKLITKLQEDFIIKKVCEGWFHHQEINQDSLSSSSDKK